MIINSAYREAQRKKTPSCCSFLVRMTRYTIGIMILSLCCLIFGTFSWFSIIGGLISANFLEYSLHRWVLHQKPQWSPSAYREHSGVHHQFFTNDHMDIELLEDCHFVMTSPSKIFKILVVGVILSSPLMMLSFGTWLFWFGCMCVYFQVYEMTHIIIHLPKTHWTYYIPFMKTFKKFHQKHHEIKVMKSSNFNVLFPLFDVLLNTTSPKSSEY